MIFIGNEPEYRELMADVTLSVISKTRRETQPYNLQNEILTMLYLMVALSGLVDVVMDPNPE